MSREINMDDPSSWSDEDRKYLQDRGKLPVDVPHVRTSAPEPTLAPNTGDVDTWVETPDVVFDDEEELPEDASYSDMTVSQLKAECRRRELPVSGTKDELAERLTQDDADRQGTVGGFEDDEEG